MSGPGGVAGDQLRAFVERIEHVDEEIKALTDDKKDIYTEAKGQGFDVKILRETTAIIDSQTAKGAVKGGLRSTRPAMTLARRCLAASATS